MEFIGNSCMGLLCAGRLFWMNGEILAKVGQFTSLGRFGGEYDIRTPVANGCAPSNSIIIATISDDDAFRGSVVPSHITDRQKRFTVFNVAGVQFQLTFDFAIFVWGRDLV